MIDQLLGGSNKFQGSCKQDEDCQASYGYEYRCFVDKGKCYHCANFYAYFCEGDTCWSNNCCALGMCVNSVCAYVAPTSYWMIFLYVILGLISCCICCCVGVCGWSKLKKSSQQRKIDQQAKGDKSCQVLYEIFQSMSRRNDFFLNQRELRENVNKNLKIVENDYFQGKAMAQGLKPVEFKTESIDDYLKHFSDHYGRYQKSYITEISNYSTTDTIKAIIVTQTHYGQKVQYAVTAGFYNHKLTSLDVAITPKLSYWQKKKQEYNNQQAAMAQYKIPIQPPYYNNTTTTNNNNYNNFDDEERRRQDENNRGAAYMRQQEEARRYQQQEYERQQQQFRDNMRRQEEQQREYQRQQQMIAEQRYREAQQALMNQQRRW